MPSRLLKELNSRSKHKEKKTAANITLPHASPFQTRQSTKKTMKHTLESLPNSSRKKMFVIVKMAIKAGIEIKGNLRKKVSQKSLSDEHCKIIQDFYLRMEYHGKQQVKRTGSYYAKILMAKKRSKFASKMHAHIVKRGTRTLHKRI